MRNWLFPVLLLMCAPVGAQDACGSASIEQLQASPLQKDPAMQKKMDRLLANLKQSRAQCLATLEKMQARDIERGLKPQPLMPRPKDATPNLCSVVQTTGVPCLKKTSETMGLSAGPDMAVFSNQCDAPLELLAHYKSGTQMKSIIKPRSFSKLLCDDCGGIKSTEVACPK